MRKLHIAMIASECVPLAKTGGLADVCGTLPRFFEELGHRCSIFLPGYGSTLRSGLASEGTNLGFTVTVASRHVACRVLKAKLPKSNVDVFFIDQPQYFDREGLYGDRQGDYRDNSERFAFFCKAVMHAIEHLQLEVDIAHCHDWQSGLIPAYMATGFGNYEWPNRAVSLMTIHNLAYQGRFWHYDMALTGMDWRYFNWKQMECYGDVCYLKTGIVFCDKITTVSPTYAREILEPEHGCGLDGVLRERSSDLVGIVNGVDYAEWNPASDANLSSKYDATNWRDGKSKCKEHMQLECGFDVDPNIPLVGIVSRLADQKGWDLIIPLLTKWLHESQVQWMILGTGDQRYQTELLRLAGHVPQRLKVWLEFSGSLAHKIEAASDIFLMPSRYEPCGLNQLFSLRYGTVPVVRATGGLADTVVDASESNIQTGIANGFQFREYSMAGLEDCLQRALSVYRDQPRTWCQIVETGMKEDWSWSRSATRYLELYDQCYEKKMASVG